MPLRAISAARYETLTLLRRSPVGLIVSVARSGQDRRSGRLGNFCSLGAPRRSDAEVGAVTVSARVEDVPGDERVRAAEMVGALCLATDLGMGFPFEHGLQGTLIAVWGAPERNPFFTTAVIALVERGHLKPPEPGGPGIFALASEARTAALLEAAGFSQVRTEALSGRFAIPSIDEYVQVIADTAGPIALALRALPDAEREAVKAHSEALEQFVVGSGYEIPCVALCAVAS
jgi:hypothetical protein